MIRKTLTIALALVFTMSLLPASVRANSDPTLSSWAVEQVNAAIAAGLVPQNLQGSFNQPTTRAEFAALAVALYENQHGEITGRNTFADTNDANVQKAAYIGIVSGVGNNMFAPNNTLTREQAAVMLSRLADAMGHPLPRQAATFADNGIISSWALDSVGHVQAAGIMSGTGNNMFSPSGTYTREQSIVTVWRLFEIVNFPLNTDQTPVETIVQPFPGTTPKIAAGSTHTMALDNNGVIWAWGNNAVHLAGGRVISGTLGVGSDDSRQTIPAQVIGLYDVVDIAVGWGSSFALRVDGTVWSWGQQRGETFGVRTSPTQVPNLENITAIAVGEFHAVALRNDGTVWTWGYNTHGQLGDGTTSNRNNPVQVQNLDNVIAIATGTYMRCAVRRGHTLAIRNDGTVWAWGSNERGQLGDGTTIDRHTPVRVQNLNNVTAIAAGNNHSMALRSDGTIWGWGCNGFGQLGIRLLSDDELRELRRQNRNAPAPYQEFHTPVQRPNIDIAMAISSHATGSMALLENGTVWAWGRPIWFTGRPGAQAPLGRAYYPVQVQGLNSVSAISMNNSRPFVIRNDGTVWGWGEGLPGMLGALAEPPDRQTPLQVAAPSGVGFLNLGANLSTPPPIPAPAPQPMPQPTPTPQPAPSPQPTPIGTPPVISSITRYGDTNWRLRDATIGQRFLDIIVTTAGSIPAEWSVVSGTLPDGMRLPNNITRSFVDGLTAFRVEGTPTATGTYTFTMRVENAAGFDEAQFTLVIGEAVPPPPPLDDFELARAVLELTNMERANYGIAPLQWDYRLAAVAREHSIDMVRRVFFAHDCPDGRTPFDRMRNHGVSFRSAAENLSWGQRTAEGVVAGWMSSPGHREAILNPNYTHMGVGFYNSRWTQKFIGV